MGPHSATLTGSMLSYSTVSEEKVSNHCTIKANRMTVGFSIHWWSPHCVTFLRRRIRVGLVATVIQKTDISRSHTTIPVAPS
jgi:hypothetical protein